MLASLVLWRKTSLFLRVMYGLVQVLLPVHGGYADDPVASQSEVARPKEAQGERWWLPRSTQSVPVVLVIEDMFCR